MTEFLYIAGIDIASIANKEFIRIDTDKAQRFYVLLERRIITSIQQAMFPACPVKQLINDLIIIVMPILPMNILALL